MDAIQGKWKISIIASLKSGALGYGQLRRAIPIATKKVLTDHLRDLEQEGIISRTVIVERILRVQYALTEHGLTLIPLLNAMCDWGENHRRAVRSKISATAIFPRMASEEPFPIPQVRLETGPARATTRPAILM
jgi:DNA-binding HxlR family transcriptional regulator